LPASAVGPAIAYYWTGNPQTGVPDPHAGTSAKGQSAGVVLVTASGKQYTFTPPDTKTAFTVPGLSPDGRWLLLGQAGNTMTLRDLESGSQKQLDLTTEYAWSSDGRLLALRYDRSPDPQATTVVTLDLRTGHTSTKVIRNTQMLSLVAVRDSGVLVFAPPGDATIVQSPTFPVALYDPSSAALLQDLTLTLSGTSGPALVTPDGLTVLARRSAGPGNLPGDIVAYDIATGAMSTHALPSPIQSQTTVPDPYSSDPHVFVQVDRSDTRGIVDVLTQGVLLAHRSYLPGQFRSDLELFDLATGRLTTVTRISGVLGVIGTAPQIYVIGGPPR
jgi:Tol biopolymer transport system component